MAKKVYAIKDGYDSSKNIKIEKLIVNTWAECQKYTKGVKGVKFKSFEDKKEAEKFLEEGSGLLKKGVDKYPEDCLHIYVDGSYNISTERYAYGLVVVRDNIVEYIESGSNNSGKSNVRQIAGELEAAVRGAEYALKNKENKVVIFHDYEGIAHHATGFWERKEDSSAKYYEKMNELMKLGLEIIFVKVDSHTGELFNELADEKCKEQLGIQSEKVIDKWLSNNSIYVANNSIKNEIANITNRKEDNIVVIEKINKEENEVENNKINIIDEIIKRSMLLNEDIQKEVLKYIIKISDIK